MSDTIFYHRLITSLGDMTVGFSSEGIRFARFHDGDSECVSLLKGLYHTSDVRAASSDNAEITRALESLFCRLAKGEDPQKTLPNYPSGTPFQREVWNCILAIPAGEVRTYQEVAHAIGAPRAVRAVASACARNHIALWIPCHRVIRADGSLGGYRWGVERKRALLEAERARCAPLTRA